MMEIIALLFVLVIHNIGELPEQVARPAQVCAPQLVEVRQVEGKIVLRGTGERVCFADIRG